MVQKQQSMKFQNSQVQSMVKVQFMRIQPLKVASTVRKQQFMMCQNSQVVSTVKKQLFRNFQNIFQ